MGTLRRAVINACQSFCGEIKYGKMKPVFRELDERTIDLGKFLSETGITINLKELTFIPGGSGVLDYAFLKTIVEYFDLKGYLEIGTYIGESINILTDTCDVLYSVTAPLDSDFSMRKWCRIKDLPDYSERLTYNSKIVHSFCDSKKFDFESVADNVDLYFIDGDHTYKGVYFDTRNIFNSRKKDSIVVWHDFKNSINRYDSNVVRAVRDVLGGGEFKNVYVTNNNMCGIYVPQNFISRFPIRKNHYEENAPLFTYNVIIDRIQVK